MGVPFSVLACGFVFEIEHLFSDDGQHPPLLFQVSRSLNVVVMGIQEHVIAA